MRVCLAVLAMMVSCCLPAAASTTYTYAFQFTDISGSHGAIPNFDLTFQTNAILASTTATTFTVPVWTPLSYQVSYLAGNVSGQFAFGANPLNIGDNSIVFDTSTFAFGPNRFSNGFYQPGVYAGTLAGNDPESFHGQALLTVTETDTPDVPPAPTPEPSTLVLLTTGLLSLVARRRR